MASNVRYGKFLMTSVACLALAGCGGADNVASPGAGSVTIVQPVVTTPTTPTPTAPAAITAAQFAAVTTIGSGANAVTVTADEQLAIVNSGSNNNVNGVGSTISGIAPVGSASLTTASNPATIDNFFTATNYVGALSGPTDNAFQNWTCNSSAATFGGTSTSCAAVPAIGTGGSTAACPTGTTDDGLVQTFRVCRLPQLVTASLTLPRIQGVVYRFRGETVVGNDVGTTGADSGVTLTIAPGVTLAADSSEATTDVLVINRGSRINAVGTANEPIIFTSQQNLTAGNVGDATQGQWGGVILLGRAPTSVCATGTGPNTATGTSTTCQLNIEGLSNSRPYGGPSAADNSGRISYAQIRFTGVALADGNELQGLTLGGTGSGTTIDHVQSHNSADDGIEIFGGNTNIKYFVVTGADDDGFDIDNGYRGFMQFIIAAQKASGATVDSFSTEIDSNGAEELLPRTFSTFANFTFIQTATAPAAIRQRGGSDMRFVNGVVRTPAGVACVNIVAGEGSGADRSTIRAANTGPTINGGPQEFGPPSFNSVYFACQGR